MRVFDNHCVVCGKEQRAITDVLHCPECRPTAEQVKEHCEWVRQYACPFPASGEDLWRWNDSDKVSTLVLDLCDEHGTKLFMSILWGCRRRVILEFKSGLEASLSGAIEAGEDSKSKCEVGAHDLWAILIARQISLEERENEGEEAEEAVPKLKYKDVCGLRLHVGSYHR